eukprot:scaffold442_cov268-Pinguiococcus_pyrenoidosus.AAC.94
MCNRRASRRPRSGVWTTEGAVLRTNEELSKGRERLAKAYLPRVRVVFTRTDKAPRELCELRRKRSTQFVSGIHRLRVSKSTPFNAISPATQHIRMECVMHRLSSPMLAGLIRPPACPHRTGRLPPREDALEDARLLLLLDATCSSADASEQGYAQTSIAGSS